eukprot:CAMPEP_0184294468 /NCGR_PEP_ID=MMETSP1049-20130417/5656_1 /TAXON_ID=77928 /ORGANISM="Proteomonas sulcata, Strain CCMP704" /LENGTH=127 /DNA_ID=CAMNT_0026602765 /DNA_START=30 /DNA_END=413 /DNA_ORIENTATION=-
MWGSPVTKDTPGLRDVTATVCSQDAMDQLRIADNVVTEVMLNRNLVHSLSQVPVVLFPAAFGVQGNRSIALRPFLTRDFMTGKPAVPGVELPFDALEEMIAGIKKTKGISRIVYDLTSKPPGTTEWE